MREYGFVRTRRAVYRLFGRHHPPGQVLLLLRYYWSAGRWRKPPVFAAEVIAGDILDRYDLPLREIQHYGITLGVGAPDPGSYAEYFDPLRAADDTAARAIARAAHLPEGQVGVTGSRLVGLAHAGSDLDLVVYGQDGPAAGAEILRASSLSHEAAAATSTTMQRLRALNGAPVPREDRRNIFKGAIREGTGVRKLDLHYAVSPEDLVPGDLPRSSRLGERRLRRMTVVEARDRHLFPAHVICRTANGYEYRTWISDHVLSLLLPGDRFSAVCTEVAVEPDGVVQYVARAVTEVDLR